MNRSECTTCEQVKKLSAENKRLTNEVELLTLLMDVGLTVIEKWWKSLPGCQDSNSPLTDGNNEVRMLLDTIGKFGK